MKSSLNNHGLAPADPSLEPYFALAEELDIPVGIHMGLAPPGVSYRNSEFWYAPKYRVSFIAFTHTDPVTLEYTGRK